MVPPRSPTSAPAPVGEAALYAQDCPDLFKLTRALEGPRQSLPARVSGLLVDLGAHPRCQRVQRLLASASATHSAVTSPAMRALRATPCASIGVILSHHGLGCR